MLPRFTMRVRLTVLYGGAFLLAGVLLTGFINLAVRNSVQAMTTAEQPASAPAPPAAAGPGGSPPADTDRPRQDAAERLNQQQDAQRSMFTQSAVALAAMALAAVGFGWLMAGSVLRPIHRITATARRVAGGRLDERLALDGPDDELKELADTFDAMLERLDASFAGQRRFIANASHELRTPLTLSRTTIEVALADPLASSGMRELGSKLLAHNERSERLIEGLLALARSQNEVTDPRSVDLDRLISQATEALLAEAEAAEVNVRTRLQGATVSGDAILLERLVLNLVQNGVRHNDPGGWVEVVTATEPGAATVVVTNTGPTLAERDMGRLFEPFRRFHPDRTGSSQGAGLGLSIVRSVTQAHSGYVHAAPRSGGGLTVRVTLPQ
jgi:signal transduction histidine kinase